MFSSVFFPLQTCSTKYCFLSQRSPGNPNGKLFATIFHRVLTGLVFILPSTSVKNCCCTQKKSWGASILTLMLVLNTMYYPATPMSLQCLALCKETKLASFHENLACFPEEVSVQREALALKNLLWLRQSRKFEFMSFTKSTARVDTRSVPAWSPCLPDQKRWPEPEGREGPFCGINRDKVKWHGAECFASEMFSLPFVVMDCVLWSRNGHLAWLLCRSLSDLFVAGKWILQRSTGQLRLVCRLYWWLRGSPWRYQRRLLLFATEFSAGQQDVFLFNRKSWLRNYKLVADQNGTKRAECATQKMQESEGNTPQKVEQNFLVLLVQWSLPSDRFLPPSPGRWIGIGHFDSSALCFRRVESWDSVSWSPKCWGETGLEG